MIYLTINGQEMTGTITSPIVCGQVNFVEIKTFFDSTWDGFDKAYQFSNNGGQPVEIVSNDDVIYLPYEASVKSGTVDISVTGTILDDDGLKVVKKVTANSLRFKVWDCNSVDDPNNVGEVTPTVVEQIRQIAEHAESVSNEMLRAKENGEFDGKNGESPMVKVERISNGAKITVTDVNGTTTAEVYDGEDEEGGGSGTGDGNPTGTVISFMGLTAPNGYLVCDGAELNIEEYSNLASHFETQFGTKNHFGGDGLTTFAVPDMRNEFIRGYHCGGEEQISGEIGVHQNGTSHTRVLLNGTKNQLIFYGDEIITTVDGDKAVSSSTSGHRIHSESYTATAQSTTAYIARPTNVAVLFCIKI